MGTEHDIDLEDKSVEELKEMLEKAETKLIEKIQEKQSEE